MDDQKLMVKCVNAHDLCFYGSPCPACEPILPLRYENGRFAPYLTEEILEECSSAHKEALTRLVDK